MPAIANRLGDQELILKIASNAKQIGKKLNNAENHVKLKRKKINLPIKEIANQRHIHCAYGDDVFTLTNRATGEHVHLHSKGGAVNEGNILPVCAFHNAQRANQSLNTYLHTKEHNLSKVFRSLAEVENINDKTRYGEFHGKQYVNNMLSTLGGELGVKPAKLRKNLKLYEKHHPETKVFTEMKPQRPELKPLQTIYKPPVPIKTSYRPIPITQTKPHSLNISG